MIIKQLLDEDFINYKKPSMFIGFSSCTFKCEKECGEHCCQNSALAQSQNIDIPTDVIVDRYMKNSITSAIVLGGLEPFDSLIDLMQLVIDIRRRTDDDIVIYTGYNENEIDHVIYWLCSFPNIIVKFGRYVPNKQPHYDDVLGVNLASDNQYARRIGTI